MINRVDSMPKGRIWSSIKELASIFESIYSIILVISIVATVILQVYPYFFQEWVIDIVRILTPILIAVLVSYILMKRQQASLNKAIEATYSTMREDLRATNEYMAVMTQAIVYSLTSVFKSKGELKDLKQYVGRIRRLDEIFSAGPKTLIGVSRTSLLGHIIQVAKWWNIPFEELGSFLVQELGKERARTLVDSADILKIYGSRNLSTWNEVTK